GDHARPHQGVASPHRVGVSPLHHRNGGARQRRGCHRIALPRGGRGVPGPRLCVGPTGYRQRGADRPEKSLSHGGNSFMLLSRREGPTTKPVEASNPECFETTYLAATAGFAP